MSEIRATTISDETGNGPIALTKQHAVKAWINFDGTTVTSSADLTGVRDSFGVASVVDNSAGDYNINFSTSMSNSNYYVGESGANNTTQEIRHNNGLTRTATAVQIDCRSNNANGYADTAYAGVGILGDLA